MATKGGKGRGRSTKGGGQGWLHSLLWFVVGLALGLAVLIPLLILGGGDTPDTPTADPPETEPDSAPDTGKPGPQGSPATAPEPPAAKRREPAPEAEPDSDGGYRFYTLLPEPEVEVPAPDRPEDPEAADAPAPAEGRTPPGGDGPRSDEDGRFLVQVAAYREREPAEGLKAKLALRGLQSRVISADLGDKGTWFRVRLGPYAGRAEAERIRDRLESDGLQGMIVRK